MMWKMTYKAKEVKGVVLYELTEFLLSAHRHFVWRCWDKSVLCSYHQAIIIIIIIIIIIKDG